MSLLSPLVERRRRPAVGGVERRAAVWPTVSQLRAVSSSGSMLRHPTVGACVQLISQMAAWPHHAVAGEGPGDRRRVPDPPILTDPSVERAPVEWRREALTMLLTRGNAAGIVTEVQDGVPAQIELVDPSAVRAQRPSSRLGRWRWTLDGADIELWPAGRLWWARGVWTVPGSPVALSPLELAADAVELASQAEQHARDWFASKGIPSAVLEVPPELGVLDDDQVQLLKARWLSAVSSRAEPAVMSGGMRVQVLGEQPRADGVGAMIDLATRSICAVWGVPPELVGGSTGDSVTYSNVESRGLHLLRHVYLPWLARWEEIMSRLMTPGVRCRVVPEALLRVDARTRAEVHSTAIRSGWMTVNEVRRLEDMGAVDGGDRLLWPPMSTSTPAAGHDGGDESA